MELTKEYLATAEQDINALAVINPEFWEAERYKITKDFCKDAKTILSVGCGPREPFIIDATHALDISPVSEKHLRTLGWKGNFCIGSATDIPFKNKSFDVVVCSEVIEHLPTTDDVIKAFKEISRVGKKWIITTPNSTLANPRFQCFAHKQFFTLESIKKIIPVDYMIYPQGIHIFIEGM